MTVSAMLEQMSHREFMDWLAFYRQRDEEVKKPKQVDLTQMPRGEVAALFGARR